MPILGLGTWTQDNEKVANSVYYALKVGYRLIDTAQYYGNEEGVGRGLKMAINDGFVTREEVFITTKIMSSSYNNAYNSINESLKKLDVNYIDLLLIHQPVLMMKMSIKPWNKVYMMAKLNQLEYQIIIQKKQ